MPNFELVVRRKVMQEAVVTVFDTPNADAAVDYFNAHYADGFPEDDAFYTCDDNGWPDVIQVVQCSDNSSNESSLG